MANNEFWGRAADVNEQFRPVKLTDETVTRPAGPEARTVHAFLRHLRELLRVTVGSYQQGDEESDPAAVHVGQIGGGNNLGGHASRGGRPSARDSRNAFSACRTCTTPRMSAGCAATTPSRSGCSRAPRAPEGRYECTAVTCSTWLTTDVCGRKDFYWKIVEP